MEKENVDFHEMSVFNTFHNVGGNCVQLYFSTFNPVFIGIVNVPGFFLCGERGGVETIQVLN